VEKKKVIHIIKGLGRGGAERLLVSTIRNAGPGWSYEVVYFLKDRDALVPDLSALNVKVTCLSSFGVPGMFLRLPALVALLRSHHAYVIHAHLPWSGIIARLAGWLTGIPVVYTEHNLFNHYNGLTRFFNSFTYRLQNRVIAVSDQVEMAIPARFKSLVPVSVINNGVDLLEFNPSLFNRQALLKKAGLPANAFVIGNVASIRPQKRMDRWISISEIVLSQIPNAHFLLVGDGKELEALRLRKVMMKHGNRVHLVGLQPEPAPWLAIMDVFLMSSDFEGLPVALLEAMAMGCIPVVTPVGGIPGVVTENENGYLYEGDDLSRASDRIIQLVGDPDLCLRLSESAKKTVTNKFSIYRMVQNLELIYRNLLNPGRLNQLNPN
jgi:glycosyltransferase involved in cell wall biosynthesis